MPTESITAPPTLTKEEQAWLMKCLWGSLQAPDWNMWNKGDLETLGKAIYSKKSLADIPRELFMILLPHLIVIVNHLGIALKTSPVPEPISSIPPSAESSNPSSSSNTPKE